MADFIPVPNVGQFNMCFTQFGQAMQNVYHLENDSPFDQVSLALAATVLKNWWQATLRANVVNTVNLTKIICRGLDTDSSPAIEFTDGLPLAGGNAAVGAPANVTIAVKWGTAYAGRSYRGRTYHIGLSKNDIIENRIIDGGAANMANLYRTLLTNLGSTPYKLVVVSRYHNNLPRATGVATEITSVSIEGYLDSQRRRLNARGA